MCGRKISLFFTLISCFILNSCHKKEGPPPPMPPKDYFVYGADVSFLPAIRKAAYPLYNQQGMKEDMLVSLKAGGFNAIRLRVWHQPDDPIHGLAEVKKLALEARSMGVKIWLSIHYSDTWADPGAQTKPKAWSNIAYTLLLDSVYQYTKQVVEQIQPEYVQIGNEINHGFLWPEGSGSNASQFFALLQSGAKAVRDNAPNSIILLHYAGYRNATDYFKWIAGVDYDAIGLSYYPIWHGKSIDSLVQTVQTLKLNTQKEVMLAEYSYPFTFAWNDYTNNVLGDSSQILPQFPATPLGQKQYVLYLQQILRENGASGMAYWGAEWVAFKGKTATNGSSFENQALWDFEGKTLPILGQ